MTTPLRGPSDAGSNSRTFSRPARPPAALEARGIARLYAHQVRAIESLRAGHDAVVVAGTASGKSLCFYLPALERMLEEPGTIAFYLFPTKALAQDQLKRLTRLAAGSPALSRVFVAASMLTAAYYMLRDGVEYRDLGAGHFDQRDRIKAANRLIRRLEELGLKVQVEAAA